MMYTDGRFHPNLMMHFRFRPRSTLALRSNERERVLIDQLQERTNPSVDEKVTRQFRHSHTYFVIITLIEESRVKTLCLKLVFFNANPINTLKKLSKTLI